MSEDVPTFDGWYPDPTTGGTRYCDGARWTGDKRPRRKLFAAASKPDSDWWTYFFMSFGVWGLPMIGGIAPDESTKANRWWWLLAGIVLLAAWIFCGIYLLRGQGPSTSSVEERLAAAERATSLRRQTADEAWDQSRKAQTGRQQHPQPQFPPPTNADAASAQIDAIANPATAKALQNLQSLLYTRALTDGEYQAAKNKILGPQANDPFTQITKLAELHRDGALGDVEFAAAKARVLGL